MKRKKILGIITIISTILILVTYVLDVYGKGQDIIRKENNFNDQQELAQTRIQKVREEIGFIQSQRQKTEVETLLAMHELEKMKRETLAERIAYAKAYWNSCDARDDRVEVGIAINQAEIELYLWHNTTAVEELLDSIKPSLVECKSTATLILPSLDSIAEAFKRAQLAFLEREYDDFRETSERELDDLRSQQFVPGYGTYAAFMVAAVSGTIWVYGIRRDSK